jgi:hypothetical protein
VNLSFLISHFSNMPTTKPTPSIHPAQTPLVCGEHGDHTGEVIGCCHICGLMLCRGHAHYLPRRSMGGLKVLHRFGMVGTQDAVPLVCGDHAPAFAARPGVPIVSAPRPVLEPPVRKAGWWSRITSFFRRSPRTRREPPPAQSRRG